MCCLARVASVLTLSLSKLVVRRSITTSGVGAVISATAQSSISVWSSTRSVAPSAEGNQQRNWHRSHPPIRSRPGPFREGVVGVLARRTGRAPDSRPRRAGAGRAPSARPPGTPRTGWGGRGRWRRRPRAARPSRAPARRRRTARRPPAPTAWMPSTRLLSARATTRTKPSSAPSVIARPLAVKGNWPMRISRPTASPPRGERPAVTISGSVKQTAGMQRWSQAAAVAGDDLGDHLALGHGAVREHRLAGDVADGVDAAHRGAALVVDADEGAVAVGVESPRAPSRRSPGGGRR